MESKVKMLENLALGQDLPLDLLKQLEIEILQDPDRSKVFEINQLNVSEAVQNRLNLLRSVYPDFLQCLETLKIDRASIETLWDLWLPLALQLADLHRQLDRPIVQGILGSQGTGKTTLGLILSLILRHLGYRCLSISIDDLYKTYADRMLLKSQDPRLIWRGPPGTHDIDLGIEVLDRLKQGRSPVLIPRFDKSLHQGVGDRIAPESIEAADIILFEGWFVGVRPIPVETFTTAPPPIITAADRDFSIDMNTKLYDYLPLWSRLDRLIVLYIQDYTCSKRWRLEAEQKMASIGKSAMIDLEVEQFVEYFWRSLHPELFLTPIIQNSELVDLVISIDANHLPNKVYKPN